MKKLPLRRRIDQIFDAYQSDLPRCEKELKSLLKEAEEAADLYSIGKINLRLSICIFRQGKRDNMLSCAYKAVSIFETMNEHALLARSYNLLGISYAAQGGFQNAISSYQKALRVIHGKKKPGISREALQNNIGDAYYQMGAYEESLRIALDCFSSCKKNQPDNHKIMALYGINLSDIYCCLKDYQKARAYLDAVEQNALLLGRDVLRCGFYTRRAFIMYAIGDAASGAEYADRVIEMVHSKIDSYEIHAYFEQIASFQIQNGDLERAQRFADVLKDYAAESSLTVDQITAKRVQAKICMAVGETMRALEFYRELNQLFEKRMREQHEMQYENQKNAELASREIAKLMERIRLSEEKAERDALTGLLNRAAMVRITNSFIRIANEKGRKLGGIFLDIDYFKAFNDTYGHTAGDEAIRLVARICMEEVGPEVQFFRYGGDEFFGVILEKKGVELESIACRIAEKVRTSVIAHAKNPNGQCLTVSIGVVKLEIRNTAHTILDVIRCADQALYHAKDAGRNTIYQYEGAAGSTHRYKLVRAKQQF